jgi:hypothetical protein
VAEERLMHDAVAMAESGEVGELSRQNLRFGSSGK